MACGMIEILMAESRLKNNLTGVGLDSFRQVACKIVLNLDGILCGGNYARLIKPTLHPFTMSKFKLQLYQ